MKVKSHLLSAKLTAPLRCNELPMQRKKKKSQPSKMIPTLTH